MTIRENFKVVGTPTISEDYIASGFSNNNYIKLTNLPSDINQDSWEFHIKITTTSSGQDIVSYMLGNKSDFKSIVLAIQRDKLICHLGTGQSFDIEDGTHSSDTLPLNTQYFIVLGYDSNQYYLKYSTDMLSWKEVFSISSDLKVTIRDLFVGNCYLFYPTTAMQGKMHLSDLQLFSNKELVWRAIQNDIIEGSITVNKGYYNADGTNIIKFTSPITKTLTEAQENLSYENKILLTLDNQNSSSFVLTGTDTADPTEYVVTKELTTAPKVYVDPSKQYILGTEPTGIDCSIESYSAEGKLWERPNLTSATSYGTVSDNRNYPNEQGWRALDGSLSTNYVPATTASWWKWELPIKIRYYQNVSKIIWVHRNNSENMEASNNLQFFADEACTIPLTDKFSDPTTSNATVEVPIISTGKTNLIYLKIGAHSGWGGAAEIKFVSFYEDVEPNGSVSLTKGWIYSDGMTYQNKNTDPLSVSILKGNTTGIVGYKNKLQLGYESSSDVSVPSISEGLTLYAYDMNTDIYLDNTKTKILGTTATSESWVVEPNYTVVGSPTVSDNGDATGFSDSNFLTIPNPFTSTMNRFTLITSFTTTNNTVSNSGIFDSPNGNTNIRLTITDTSKLHFRISTNGEQPYPVDITGTTTIENNKKYWAKVEYDSSRNYSIYLSEDGHVWNQEAFAIITDRPYYTSGIQNVIGDNTANGSYFEGTLHLADWSITVDGVKVWEYLKKPYSINTGTSATDTGSITYTAGYKYIDETNGSLFIQNETTKTLEQLVVGDKTEQMGLYLINKTDLRTDFILSATSPTTDISYSEKVVDVYLDKTLSYIYGTEPQQLGEDEVLVTLNVPEGSNVLIYDEDNNTLFENTI